MPSLKDIEVCRDELNACRTGSPKEKSAILKTFQKLSTLHVDTEALRLTGIGKATHIASGFDGTGCALRNTGKPAGSQRQVLPQPRRCPGERSLYKADTGLEGSCAWQHVGAGGVCGCICECKGAGLKGCEVKGLKGCKGEGLKGCEGEA
ncbi:unnamed protein product [Effrenium voratum]|nr:unnamed protein product [Effrenium voratum]